VNQGGVSIAIKRMFAPFPRFMTGRTRHQDCILSLLVELREPLDEVYQRDHGRTHLGCRRIFWQQNLLISLTANEEILPNAFDELGAFISM
jgi:hypothetical protein